MYKILKNIEHKNVFLKEEHKNVKSH